MKTTFLPLFLLFFNLHFIICQNSEYILFETKTHDFGEIIENNGVVNYNFIFINKSTNPLQIKDINTNCECILTDWSKSETLPGKSDIIKISYNPKKRIGPFDKLITVVTNLYREPIVLKISGNVIHNPLDYEKLFKYEIGNIRFKSKKHSFGTIFHDQITTITLELFNQSEEVILINIKETIFPKHIYIRKKNLEIQPKKSRKIVFKYNANKKNEFGNVFDYLQLKTNDREKPFKRIYIYGKINEKFPSDLDQKDAPIIIVDKNEINLGEILPKKTIDTSVAITNKGKTNLILRKLSNSCGCTNISLPKNEILPGETITVKIGLNINNKSGEINENLNIISNDPNNPETTLKIIGHITTNN